MGLEGQSTLSRTSLSAAVEMCAWGYSTRWRCDCPAPVLSVTVENSAKSRMNEFWFSFGWLSSLQTSPFFPLCPAQTAGSPPCPCDRAVQGERLCRMWTQPCVCAHPSCKLQPGSHTALPCCYWYSKHMLLSVGLGFQGWYSTLPAPFPQVSLETVWMHKSYFLRNPEWE